jgi:hypothetical protein
MQMKIRQAALALSLYAPLLAASALHLAAQNPFAALAEAAKEKLAEQAISTLLNNQLPLTLNASDVYPTVATLPGGPFNPQPLQLTADELNQPLPPGDYTINTLDFCSEYSVHEPGAGVAYVLGPYEGKAAGAIGALIWRGTVQYHINPNSLQAVSWTIQSGLTYAQMPKTYQAIVDQVIPDYKSEITADFIANLEITYNNAARTAKLPPLDSILVKLGKPGELALTAELQRAILTSQNTNDQLREQTLFQGQQSGLYTPVKAETGPWTERVKGQVYMKLLIAGGNMATNNVMQIRIMPSPTANARNAGPFPNLAPQLAPYPAPHLVRAAYGEPQTAPAGEGSGTSLMSLMEGMIGYSQGRGAQALGQVPVVAPSTPVQAPPAPPVIAQEPPVPPAQAPPATPASTSQNLNCPVGKFPAGTHPNIAFTSYTSEVTNEQLYNDFQGLYNAGFNQAGLIQGSFADRMNQIAVSGQPVGFFVVNGDDASYQVFQEMSVKAYTKAKVSGPNLTVPSADEFAMTIPRPKSLCGGYEVVISQQSLMHGSYQSKSAKTNPVTEPIQIPMAYELGTNVYNQVKDPGSAEQMTQPDTNRFILAEFSWFPPNSSLQTGSATYGSLHGVLDLLDPAARGPLNPVDVVPTSSLYTDPAQGANTQQGQIWIPSN